MSFVLQLEDGSKVEVTDKEDKELTSSPPPIPKRNFPGNDLPPVDQATDNQSPVDQVSQTIQLKYECGV